jgi:hypothetical protein
LAGRAAGARPSGAAAAPAVVLISTLEGVHTLLPILHTHSIDSCV